MWMKSQEKDLTRRHNYLTMGGGVGWVRIKSIWHKWEMWLLDLLFKIMTVTSRCRARPLLCSVVADLCQSTICRLFILSRRKDDKLGCLAFCRLFALLFFRGEKTTIIVLSSCRYVVFSRRKDDKTTKRRAKRRQIRSLISGLCLSSFRSKFVILSTFRFVVFLGRKDDNYRLVVLSFCRLFASTKRKDDKL
jgi:hypothetical protein